MAQTQTAAQRTTVECPECAANVPLAGNVLVGEILDCPDCGCELEVRATNPVRVELAPQVEEDWGE
ncbi:MAG TPA: lysine biosynthesis protein LysW [Candidatus Thermoplasmatota archaeon]|nr:lysine biosynthesis protein LysW [Candidatus Thermoplasmatota archaeon]